MSTEQAAAGQWPVLGVNERRLLGVLVEKAKTTPDVYPLSINALVTGSNQKSNREPTLNLSDADVEEALTDLQKKGLVTRVTGSRVDRWRHNLYENWQVGKVELAVLAELLLRGAQTEGELRGRASRMEPIDDLEVLRKVLRPLAERGLIVFLGPEGRRGTLITHGFHTPAELEQLRRQSRVEDVPSAAPSGGSAEMKEVSPGLAERVALLESRLNETRAELAALKAQVQSILAPSEPRP